MGIIVIPQKPGDVLRIEILFQVSGMMDETHVGPSHPDFGRLSVSTGIVKACSVLSSFVNG